MKVIFLKYCYPVLSLFLLLLSAGCDSKPQVVTPSPKGYRLGQPQTHKLPLALDEISGIFFHAEDSSLFAIQDERGILYKIPLDPRRRNIETWQFGLYGDYEDIVIIGKTFFVLKSNGNISAFNFSDSGVVRGHEYPFQLAEGSEFETLYYEPKLHKLVLICKDCPQDKKKTVSTFTFDPDARTFDTSSMQIDAEGIAGAFKQKSIKFKPSGAAISPISGELYILSAVNRLLVVTDRQGRTQEVYQLPSNLFKQPEGITFSPSGMLYISNEAADIGVANILIYNFKRPESRN